MSRDNQTLKQQVLQICAERSSFLAIRLGALCDTADFAMADSIEEYRKAGVYRHRVKQLCKRATAESRRLREIYYNDVEAEQRDYYIDLMDTLKEQADPEVNRLLFCIKQVLDRHRQPHAMLSARTELALVLLDIAKKAFQVVTAQLREDIKDKLHVDTDTERMYVYINPTTLFLTWRNLRDEVCRHPEEVKQALYEDETVSQAAQAVADAVCNSKRIEQVLRAVLAEHPEAEEVYEEKVRQGATP